MVNYGKLCSCEDLNRQQYEAHQIQLIFYAGGPLHGDFRRMKRRRRFGLLIGTPVSSVGGGFLVLLVGSEPGLPGLVPQQHHLRPILDQQELFSG